MALAVSGFTSIAASLIFAVVLLNQSLHETPDRPNHVAQVQQVPAPRPHPIEEIAPSTISPAPEVKLVQDDRSPRNPEVPHPEIVAPVHPAAPPAEVSERENRRVVAGILERPHVRRVVFERENRRVVAGILERPHVRRVVIVTDVIDASERVRDLIQQDARQMPEFGRITICQDIIIDPERAEAAEVFAVPMDERGRRSFVDRLKQRFPNLVEEGQSSPGLVTQLGEVGQVAVFRGAEAAPLGDPPADLPVFIANREGAQPLPILEHDRNPLEPAGPVNSGQPPRVQPANVNGVVASKDAKASPDFVGPPDLDGMAPPRLGEQVTLLVWVTRPGRR